MNNYVQPGKVLSGLTAPYDRTVGQGVQVGAALFGVAVDTVTSGDTDMQIDTEGVYDITKGTAFAPAAGARLYWDNTNKQITTTSSGNLEVGVAIQAATSAETTARVKLGAIPATPTA